MDVPKINTPRIIEPELLLAGYRAGYFPMAESRQGELRWCLPEQRGIIPIEDFKITRSLRQTLSKKMFSIKLNTAFEEVMQHCAEREETWISDEIIQSYVRLHHLGYAHSVEAWREEKLVGGLYGVTIGAVFFGESMFSKVRDASKVALAHLVNRLQTKKFELLDTQFVTPHLKTFGAIEIPHEEYLVKLKKAIRKRRTFLD